MKKIPQHSEFSISQRIYKRLLLAYPRLHRAKYGAEMAQLFRDQCRDAWRESQNWGLLKLWFRVFPDLVSTSILERLAALNERKSMTDKLANLFGFRTTPAITFFRVFVVIFLLVFLASVVITFILPESYASTARIEVESNGPVSGAAPQIGASAYDPYFLQTTFEIIQTQVVLNSVIDKLNLNTKWGNKYNGGKPLKTEDTMRLLKQRVSLSPERNTKLINITVYGEDKVEAAQIANAITESYRDYRAKLQAYLATKELEASQNQFQKDEEQIQQAQTDLESLRQQFNIASGASVSQSPREKPYWDKKHDLETMIESNKLLAAKIKAEKLEIQIPKRPMVMIVDAAKPGMRPVRPNKPLNIVVGAIAGTFLASMAGAIAALLAFFIGKRMRKTAAAT